MRTSSRSAVERWSLTPNVGRRSTSSPHRSMRTGASAVDGNTSTIAPRRATSPRCSTSSSRRYPTPTSRRDQRRRGRRRRRGAPTIGSTSSTSGPSRWSSARTPATTTAGHRARDRAAATAARGAGPSSRRDGLHPLERQRLPRREQLDLVGAAGTGRGRRRAGRPSCRSGRRRRAGAGATGRRGRRRRSAAPPRPTASRASGSASARVRAPVRRAAAGVEGASSADRASLRWRRRPAL